MITTGEAYLNVRRDLPEEALAEFGRQVFEIASVVLLDLRPPYETDLIVRVEQGSRRSRATLATAVGALVFYGSIRESLDYLVHDGRWFAGQVNERIIEQEGIHRQEIIRGSRRTGLPGRLNRLFWEVANGELSPDEATAKALTQIQRVAPEAFQLHPDLPFRLSGEFRDTIQEVQYPRPRRGRGERPPTVPYLRELPLPGRGVLIRRNPDGTLHISEY